MSIQEYRRKYFTDPLFTWAQKALPSMSETEQEAMEAGDVWWEGDLFSGHPDYASLSDLKTGHLSEEEQAFLDGPAEELCAMLDDWQISSQGMDLPEEVWTFMKEKKFFGMIVPKDYGGLGFSATAHSEVVKRLSTRSVTAAVTVMVPNSLGPGELLMQFGTQEQKDYYLPRLADGREIPCFALTSDEAGSDAASMTDSGVVCKEMVDGKEVTGIRLNFSKRYITLAPIATLLGLAFKLRDPDGLLGGEKDLGITVALVPADTDGVTIGRRHLPAMQAFQNGPIQGKDVFVPLSAIIGGQDRIGQGWMMLMAALAAGRGISLPSLATAAACHSARVTGAYARVRRQFGISIGKFEGVQEALARIAGIAYELEAARRFTCAGLDTGHHPAIASAIMKAHATNRMRIAVNDAMDVHGGKAIIDGPLNYLGNVYRSIPVGITVEGANIVTRSLIIFGQGATRAHPYLSDEMVLLANEDEEAAKKKFDPVLMKHTWHIIRTTFRAFLRGWSAGILSPAPRAGAARKYYRQLSRYSAALAFASEVALISLGGKLKFKEMISARLGDVLSELYIVTAVLKRWEDEGRHEEDLPLVEFCCRSAFSRIELALKSVAANFPSRPLGWLMRIIALPYASYATGPKDKTVTACAEIAMSHGAQRDRLIVGTIIGEKGGPIAKLERAFELVIKAEPIEKKMRERKFEDDVEGARAAGVISEEDVNILKKMEKAVHEAVVVDDFAPDEIVGFIHYNEDEPPGRAGMSLVQSSD